jgi:hypothetical protein
MKVFFILKLISTTVNQPGPTKRICWTEPSGYVYVIFWFLLSNLLFFNTRHFQKCLTIIGGTVNNTVSDSSAFIKQ